MLNLVRRLRARWRYRSFDQDLRRELQVHRHMVEDDLRSGGVPSADASRRAAHLMGPVNEARELSRRVWIAAWLDELHQDVRIGLRMLVKRPELTGAALLSLAVGIGTNTAVFSVTSAVLLKPLPYADPARLVMIWAAPTTDPAQKGQATAAEYFAWQQYSTVFEDVGTEQQSTRDIGADEHGPAETLATQNLTLSLYRVLGVRPAIGRYFRPDEEGFSAEAAVVLISHSLWRRRFQATPDIVGQTVRLDGVPTTIIGVLPEGFSYLDRRSVDLYGPRMFARAQLGSPSRSLAVAAKLKPGVSVTQAQAEMDALARRLAADLPASSRDMMPHVQPMHEALYGGITSTLVLLESVVGFVLLIACANVAGLLVTRGMARRTEMAVRAAIGAGRTRLVRQVLTESMLLAGFGGLAGVALAWVFLQVLIATGPAWIPRLEEVAIDGRVLAFTTVVVVATGVLFGLAPAVQGFRTDLLDALKVAVKGGGPSRRGLRDALVVAQVALAVLLLLGSGLFIRSFIRLKGVDLGYSPANVLTFDLQFAQAAFQRTVGAANGQQLLEINPATTLTFDLLWQRLRALDGVRSAAGDNMGPTMPYFGRQVMVAAEGRTAQPGTEVRSSHFVSSHIVTPGFFKTMGIPLARGRDFAAGDTANTPWVTVVNEAFAREAWPNEDAVGKRVRLGLVDEDSFREVIGVVGNQRLQPYGAELPAIMYTSHLQQPPHTVTPYGGERRYMTFFLKIDDGQAAGVTTGIRDAMRSINPEKGITSVRFLETDLAEQISWPRYMMTLLSLFAGAAMLLTAIGIYALMANIVAERTREVGIRMALGATPWRVVAPVIRRALVLVGVGLAAGVTSGFFLARAAAALLVEVSPHDLPTFVGMTIVMLVVGLGASLIPASRAARVAPTVALRYE